MHAHAQISLKSQKYSTFIKKKKKVFTLQTLKGQLQCLMRQVVMFILTPIARLCYQHTCTHTHRKVALFFYSSNKQVHPKKHPWKGTCNKWHLWFQRFKMTSDQGMLLNYRIKITKLYKINSRLGEKRKKQKQTYKH